MGEVELVLQTTTCHTPGCENEGIPVTWWCTDAVTCGVCWEPITDKQTVSEGSGS